MIETTGDVVMVTPPPSVAVGQQESNQIVLFEEQQDVLLDADLLVDVRTPGNYGPNANSNDFPQDGSIPAGTLVSSFYVHADQFGASGSISLSGGMTFDTDILGIAFTAERQSSTVGVVGLPGTTYDSSGAGVTGRDQIVLGGDRRTVTFNAIVGSGVDNFRVIVAGIPEPATITILAVGGLALFRRRVV